MNAGVQIYEYTPGFIHAKNVIVDDECAICGTINTDYRSFYLHYECGVFISEMEAVQNMKDDFLRTIEQCDAMDMIRWSKRPIGNKLIQGMLRVISPLL